MTDKRPILGVTMGDASGAGPEILVKALAMPEIRALCRPLVFGHAPTIARAAEIVGSDMQICPVASLHEALYEDSAIDVLEVAHIDLDKLEYGKVQAMSGQGAYDCIVRAVELALAHALLKVS